MVGKRMSAMTFNLIVLECVSGGGALVLVKMALEVIYYNQNCETATNFLKFHPLNPTEN